MVQADLNALSLQMIQGIMAQLRLWQDDKNIQAVLINSTNAKAFSAGGDVRYLYDSYKAGTTAYQDYFATEYQMLDQIREYSKPIIALIDGYAFGGGFGLAQACHIRISSDKSRFAMPETGIGFFPDVGGTYFLSRLGELGVYLALTGEQFTAADALYLGLVDYLLPSDSLPSLEAALMTNAVLDQRSIEQIIEDFALPAQDSVIQTLQAVIKHHFAHDNLATIEHSLAHEQHPEYRDWANKVLSTLQHRSLLAKQVSLKLQWIGRELPLAQCMQLERDLQDVWFDHGDFIEGVRALLVDKDKQPNWQKENHQLQQILEEIFAAV